VIDHRHFGAAPLDTSELHDMTYLLESGTDRIGALDFQESATQYLPHCGRALDELMEATERLEAGEPFSRNSTEHCSKARHWGARPKRFLLTVSAR